jgi:uncharacterized membrane protein HdeD (DUF308 family)
MSSVSTQRTAPSITDTVREKWGWFLALGIVLVIGGMFAILAPVASTIATSLVVGIVLLAGGVMQVIHAFQTKTWGGFLWDLLIGVVQIVGGAAIYFDPFAGAIALTLVIASIFIVQGIMQVMLALKVRPHDGWIWLLISGVLSIGVALVLMLRFPVAGITAPGILVGISLLFAGWSYLIIALAAKRLSAA